MRRTATPKMADLFGLTEEERNELTPSGTSKTIRNRIGWAMSHLTKAGFIEKVAQHTYRTTSKGKEYLKNHSGPITPTDLRQIDGLVEAWEEASKKRQAARSTDAPTITVNRSVTPEEQIDDAISAIDDTLKSELLENLHEIDPFRFEQVVIDLLFAMGYGGSREEAARVTKKSNDEGIDGVINEDRLGLDVIYVQAKRWQNTVGRKEIQSFVGALAGKQANKGVFITTSDFAATATDYARSVAQKVVLIDGDRLAELMIEHNIGVSTVRTISVKRIDTDYFQEN